ncbi:MAG: PAS domain S-box protein, partial [Abitibacteriaceae bacterium]|nr:PAS domain S-box protein [Abditibacteriaceae bacterium]
MTQPPVRELLSNYLLKRQDTVLDRMLELVKEAPDLREVQELANTRDYRQAVSTLLKLLVQNISDPTDRRCFHYAHQRAHERFRQNIPATQMMRLAGMHRQVLTKMVQRQFGDEPALVRRMSEIIDDQISEIELTFTDAYQSARDRQWQASETKYFSLFENASEAIISFRPGEGRIIEVNMQAERLLRLPRSRLLGSSFSELFPPEHQEQVQWLTTQSGGSSNIRLEDMTMQRPDGGPVPVSLSCNWINVDSNPVAQVIVRDVTQLRQMQHELRNYAEQLEERVADRTRELQQSEERYRDLFLQEQRRARHLSLINEVQKCALTTRDVESFLDQATVAIQTHFRDCDATFFLCEPKRDEVLAGTHSASTITDATAPTNSATNEDKIEPAAPAQQVVGDCGALIAVAQAGGHGLAVPIGWRHPLDVGLPGQVAQHGETLYITHENAGDGNHQRAPGVYRDAQSEICVPVVMEGEIIGAISVQSAEAYVFDAHDAVALQTAATIISAHIQSSRLFREMHELSEFNETLITSMLHSLMVVDREGHIKLVNERLSQTLRTPREALLNQPITSVLGKTVTEKYRLADVICDVTANGTPHELQEIHVWTPESTLIFDIRLSRVYFRGEAQVVVLLINLTLRFRKAYQLQMLNEMGRMFQASLDINRVLHTVLTCITAGAALGFNRAFLLLREEGNDVLKGALALGPSSAEEAGKIWHEISVRELSLQEILAQENTLDLTHLTPLQERTLGLTLDLNNPYFSILADAVRARRAVLVRRDEIVAPQPGLVQVQQQEQRQAVLDLFTASEIAIAPLVAKDRIVGLVLADNLYSGHPIEPDDIQLLDTLAQQASLTVDNALTYQALQKAQKELVSAERLAVVGEMAARVSHEIRNPLATIGGFARSVLKRPDDIERVQRKTEVIVGEVTRLEELLTDLLDMTRPRGLDLHPHSINEIVEHALLLAEADFKAAGVTVEKHLDPNLLPMMVDRSRLLQALLNTIRNGAQSMP